MKKHSLLGGGFVLVGVMMLLWGCMNPTIVEQWAKVSLSYLATDPETMEVVTSGEKKDLILDFTGSELFQLLSGAKKDEIRTWILIDPFTQHDENLVQKQTAVVMKEMGLPLKVGEVVEIAGKSERISQIVNEDGIEQVVLDANLPETILPLEWRFTISEIH